MEEETESELFVIQGIKTEVDDWTSGDLTLKIDIKNEDINSVEEVSNDVKFSEEILPTLVEENGAAMMKTENVTLSGCENSVHDENYLHVNDVSSEVNQNNFKKCNDEESGDIQSSSGSEQDVPLKFRRSKKVKLRTYRCKTYDCRFASKLPLDNHAVYVHGEEKPFKCGECGYVSNFKSRLANHMSVHEKEHPFKCSQCDHLLCSQKSMELHIRTVHSKENAFKCPVCSFSSSSMIALTVHTKSVHSELKPYKCTECDCAFNALLLLTNHIRSAHRTGLPFKCSFCDYSSYKMSYLTGHLKMHRKLKPFKCGECGKSFSLKRILTEHTRKAHRVVRPYKCEECDFSYCTNKVLVKHCRKMHGKEII